ncbi:FecR domain-containing protein [Cryomorphaceae bacterium]|nr:FecR domain-containing protein [Cryomorphaceae bacterium]
MSHEGAEHSMYELVVKQLAGETSPAEDREVAAWVEDSVENAKEYERIQQVWDASKISEWTPDVDVAWARMSARMHRETPVIDLKPKRRPMKVPALWRVAAAVAILFVALWFIRQALQTRPDDYRDWSGQVAALEQVIQEELKDDSKVALKPQTTLFVADDFGRKERAVALEGSAQFSVAKDVERPFTVWAGEVTVEVLGTEFLVEAYPDSGFVRVDVSEGLVAVMSAKDTLRLSAGETVRFERGTGVMLPQEQKPDAFFWSNRSLDFRRTPLDEVVATLNRNYQSNLVLANPQLANCRLTANFNDQVIDDIVDVLSATLNLEVRKEMSTWIIDGTGCAPSL